MYKMKSVLKINKGYNFNIDSGQNKIIYSGNTFRKDHQSQRPLKNVHFFLSSRKTKFYHSNTIVFRGLKFECDAELGQKGALFKGFS